MDELGRMYGEIENEQRRGTSHSQSKKHQGQASGNLRTTKSGMDADKERKHLDLLVPTELPRDSLVRDRCDDWAEWHGWNGDPRHGMQATRSNARNDQITGQGRHSIRAGTRCIMAQRSDRAAEVGRLIETASKGSYRAHKGDDAVR